MSKRITTDDIADIASDEGTNPASPYPIETTIILARKYLALQAKLDRVMLEYCPDDMTAEQITGWGQHQVPTPTHGAHNDTP
jgi:hypothetical protein